MRKNLLLTALFLLMGSCLFAQNDKSKRVTTIGIIDTMETKSGYRINEYYIELTKNQLDSLKGKKVSVTGKLLIVEGIDPTSKEMVQGSLNDRFFITEPKFTIVYDTREPLIQDSSPY